MDVGAVSIFVPVIPKGRAGAPTMSGSVIGVLYRWQATLSEVDKVCLEKGRDPRVEDFFPGELAQTGSRALGLLHLAEPPPLFWAWHSRNSKELSGVRLSPAGVPPRNVEGRSAMLSFALAGACVRTASSGKVPYRRVFATGALGVRSGQVQVEAIDGLLEKMQLILDYCGEVSSDEDSIFLFPQENLELFKESSMASRFEELSLALEKIGVRVLPVFCLAESLEMLGLKTRRYTRTDVYTSLAGLCAALLLGVCLLVGVARYVSHIETCSEI